MYFFVADGITTCVWSQQKTIFFLLIGKSQISQKPNSLTICDECFLCNLYEYFWMFSKRRWRRRWISSAVIPWINSPFCRRCGWVCGVGWPNVSRPFCKRDSRWSDICNDSLLTLEDDRLGRSKLKVHRTLLRLISLIDFVGSSVVHT